MGRVSVFYGPKDACKTTLILKAIASAQHLCSKCWLPGPDLVGCKCGDMRETVVAFFDVEGVLDLEWAVQLGVDTDRLLVSQPETAESTLDMGETLLRDRRIDIMVIDSLAFLTPLKEIESKTEQDLMGQQARTLGKGVRKFTMALNAAGNADGRKPSIWCTNQLRASLAMFTAPEVQPGGKAPGYAASAEIRVSQGKRKFDDATKKPIHVDFNFKADKVKVMGGVAKSEGDFRMCLSNTEHKRVGDSLDEAFVIEQADRYGLIEKVKGGLTVLGRDFGAKSDIELALLSEPVFAYNFRSVLMDVLKAI